MFSRIPTLAVLLGLAVLSGAATTQADDDDGAAIIEGGQSEDAPEPTSTIIIRINRGNSAFPDSKLPQSQMPRSQLMTSQLPQSNVFGVER